MNKLVWLRNDLRMDDHPAFHAACEAATEQNSAVYAVYVICDAQWEQHDVAPARRYLVLKTLECLSKSLHAKGIRLVVLQGTDFDASISAVAELAHSLNADSVYIHYEMPLNERLRDKKANAEFERRDLKLRALHGTCLLPPKSVLKDDGEPYRVYTPFKNKCLPFLDQIQPLTWRYNQAVPDDDGQWQAASAQVLTQALSRYEAAAAIANQWLSSERQILGALQEFCESIGENSLMHYKKQRDIPSLEGTSKLSPYLSLGSLSPRRALHQAAQVYRAKPNISEGFITWRNELVWRDFYRHILVMYPELSKGRAFKEQYEALPWLYDAEFVEAWKSGQTGYPIVDAAMRQLNTTGWMHNRLRMVTAMFFTKYALHDWHIGERYFMSQLVDGDFAANNGGWQWSSSTGTDAAPYFRLLSPLRQAERFDAQAQYIKTFVPELADVPAKDIVKLKPSISQGTGYPAPIFDTKGKKDAVTAFFKAHR